MDDGVYTKNADIVALVGINAGTDAKAVAQTDVYVLNVEAAINTRTGTDWSTAWTASQLDDNGTMKLTLTQTGAAGCAMNVINADLTNMSQRERETILDYLNSMYEGGIKMLSDTGGSGLIAGS